MRHFAARFVRQSVNQITKAKGLGFDKDASTINIFIDPVYVLEPYLDLRDRFINAIELKQNLDAREFWNKDLTKIYADYIQWWNAYAKFIKNNSDDQLNVINNRHELLDNNEGLLRAVELPNDIDVPSSSNQQQSINPTFLAEIQTEVKKIAQEMSQKIGCEKLLPMQNRFHCSSIIGLFRNFLIPGPILIRSTLLVRPAIVQCCNIALEKFPIITDGLDSPMCLVGVGLPSFLPLLVKRHFNEKSNQWPIVMMADGASYYSDGDSQFGQNHCVNFLVLGRDELECMQQEEKIRIILTTYLNEFVSGIVTVDVKPSKLHFWERSAKSLQLRVDGGEFELTRFSKIGDYLSKRGQIMFGSTNIGTPKFLQMAFVNLDVSVLTKFSSF